MWPWSNWVDVDPARHAFGIERVRPALLAIVRARMPGRIDGASQEIHAAIVAEYGSWASGWAWSLGNGGPTAPPWHSDATSVLLAGETGPEPTVERALAALASWRAFLVDLDQRFAALRLSTAGLDLGEEIGCAASHLLALVVARTLADDAWYQTFELVMRWYLDAAGLATPDAQLELAEVVSARFDSWVAPEPEVANDACGQLARQLVPHVRGDAPRDGLADWLRARDRSPGLRGDRLRAEPSDAHAAYIETFDRSRDAERADRMAAALVLCRDSARRGLALAVDQLAEWQGVVLGLAAPAALRTTDAFGKRGRERYGCPVDLHEQLERVLAEAEHGGLPIAVRAARAYLDVCFFHPFADGNARSARLALDHVLAREGLGLAIAEPVFSLTRGAHDPDVLTNLAAVVDRALAPLE